jgi:hypothetical protein
MILFFVSQIALLPDGIKRKMPRYLRLASFNSVEQNKTKQNKQANTHTQQTHTPDDKTSRKEKGNEEEK